MGIAGSRREMLPFQSPDFLRRSAMPYSEREPDTWRTAGWQWRPRYR